MSFFSQQFPQDQAGAVGLRGIEGRLLADLDAPLLPPRQNLAFGGRFHAAVLKIADNRIFLYLEDNDLATARAVFEEEFGRQRIEQPHPQDGLQIALRQPQVETILWLTLDVVKNGLFGYAAITANFHVLDNRLGACLRTLRQNRDGGN